MTAPACRLRVEGSGYQPVSATLKYIHTLGVGGYFLLFASISREQGREERRALQASVADLNGSKEANLRVGEGGGDLDFHQSPGICLRSPGRSGRLRRAAELTDESEFFSSSGGVGSEGPGGQGGEARGRIAVPGCRGNFQGLGASRRARLGGAWRCSSAGGGERRRRAQEHLSEGDAADQLSGREPSLSPDPRRGRQ